MSVGLEINRYESLSENTSAVINLVDTRVRIEGHQGSFYFGLDTELNPLETLNVLSSYIGNTSDSIEGVNFALADEFKQCTPNEAISQVHAIPKRINAFRVEGDRGVVTWHAEPLADGTTVGLGLMHYDRTAISGIIQAVGLEKVQKHSDQICDVADELLQKYR